MSHHADMMKLASHQQKLKCQWRLRTAAAFSKAVGSNFAYNLLIH